MSKEYIGIQYDRSHLKTSYDTKFLQSLHHPLDSVDLVLLLLNVLAFMAILAIFLYRRARPAATRTIRLERLDKNNQIPYFTVVKNQKKSKGRENYGRDSKDQTNIEVRCEKCKYSTQIYDKTFLSHSER